MFSCVFQLDLFDLCFSSSAAFVVVVRWFYWALACLLSDCLLQQGLHNSNQGEVMIMTCLRLAPVLVAFVSDPRTWM